MSVWFLDKELMNQRIKSRERFSCVIPSGQSLKEQVTKTVEMSFLLTSDRNCISKRKKRLELGHYWRMVVYEVTQIGCERPLYIGSTMYTAASRLRQHLRGKNGASDLGRFIRENGYDDLDVTLYAAADQPSLRQLERELIAERKPIFNER